MKMEQFSAKIRSLFKLIPKKEGWRSAEFVVMGKRTYRGRERYVAGYSHSRMYAHSMSGSTTDRIIGYGDSQEAAIKMMEEKLRSPAAASPIKEGK